MSVIKRLSTRTLRELETSLEWDVYNLGSKTVPHDIAMQDLRDVRKEIELRHADDRARKRYLEARNPPMKVQP